MQPVQSTVDSSACIITLSNSAAGNVLNMDSLSGIKKALELGFSGHVGDATQVEVLEEARIASAQAVVITIPHHLLALAILEHVKRLAPRAYRIVRSRHQIHANEFLLAGANMVVGDEEQVGRSLGDHLKEWLDEHADGKRDRAAV